MPAIRPTQTTSEPRKPEGGGSGSRSGASASLVRSSAIATSPTNAPRCRDRLHGGSGAGLGGAVSPVDAASPAGFGAPEVCSGSGGRAFFGAYFSGSSFDGP